MTWLRVSMSYHRFPNLSQKFNSDLNNKVMENVYDKGYEDQKCNCSVTLRKEDGSCLYKGVCRRSTVIYQVDCALTGKSYVGKTQNYLKERV